MIDFPVKRKFLSIKYLLPQDLIQEKGDMRNCFVCALSLSAILFATVIHADELSDLKKKVDRQQDEINELRQSLKELQQGGESITMKPIFGANLGLFGDVNLTTSSREQPKNSFYLGEVDLYSTGSYGERLTFLAELLIEGEDHGFALDMERLWAAYTFSDLLVVRGGKQHTALGYWNKTYHHGKQLFLTIDRPFFLNFEDEGGVLPIHITGLELEGRWGYSFAWFKYEFEVGNGPLINKSTRRLMPNDQQDDNDSKQIVLRISGKPTRIPNLSIGISGSAFEIDTAAKTLLENIYGIDIAYDGKGFESIAEYFRLRNSDAAGDAFYIQLGYNIAEGITPYARFESLDSESNDPYLGNLANGFDRRQFLAGIKYDIDEWRSSIKAQYRYDDSANGNDYSIFEMQWSFGF
jgi:hypothetical protein